MADSTCTAGRDVYGAQRNVVTLDESILIKHTNKFIENIQNVCGLRRRGLGA
jgi:hypothetical protein